MINASEIKKLLIEDLEKAIDKLESSLDSNIYLNQLIEIKARYVELKKEMNRGLIGQDDYKLELNRIRVSTLDLIDKIPENGINNKKSEEISKRDFPNPKKINKKWILLVLIFALIISSGIIGYSKYSPNRINREGEIKTLINTYYSTLMKKEFETMGVFYTDPVEKYYDRNNVYLDRIIRDLRISKKNVIEESVDVDWTTFKVMENGDDYYVEYIVNYTRVDNEKGKGNYHLIMKIIMDENLKMKSIYEVKIN